MDSQLSPSELLPILSRLARGRGYLLIDELNQYIPSQYSSQIDWMDELLDQILTLGIQLQESALGNSMIGKPGKKGGIQIEPLGTHSLDSLKNLPKSSPQFSTGEQNSSLDNQKDILEPEKRGSLGLEYDTLKPEQKREIECQLYLGQIRKSSQAQMRIFIHSRIGTVMMVQKLISFYGRNKNLPFQWDSHPMKKMLWQELTNAYHQFRTNCLSMISQQPLQNEESSESGQELQIWLRVKIQHDLEESMKRILGALQISRSAFQKGIQNYVENFQKLKLELERKPNSSNLKSQKKFPSLVPIGIEISEWYLIGSRLTQESLNIQKAQAQITKLFTPIINRMAKRFLTDPKDHFDLMQEGWMGFWTALKSYHSQKITYPFDVYAKGKIQESMRKYFQFLNPISASHKTLDLAQKINRTSLELQQVLHRAPTDYELAQKLKISIVKLRVIRQQIQPMRSLNETLGNDSLVTRQDALPGEPQFEPEIIQEKSELRKQMEQFFYQNLPPNQAKITTMFFGLNAENHPSTIQEISQKLGICKSRVRELKKKSLQKIRHLELTGFQSFIGAN